MNSTDTRVADVLAVMDRLAPFEWAASWDNVGLQIGDGAAVVRRIGVALEVTPPVVAEAVERGVDLLVVHHPLIFKPLKSLARQGAVGTLVWDLASKGIALIAAHTNLDASPAGTNGALAERLALRDVVPLFDLDPRPAAYKLVVYTPKGYERAMIDAIARGGGGVIGDYDHCSFRTEGTGTFRPLDGATPFAGEVGRLEEADEWRLEFEVPRSVLGAVMREVTQAHPYEEMAYDLIPRERVTTRFALGLRGRLDETMTLEALIRRVEAVLPKGDPLSLIGDPNRSVQTVAVFSGSGRMAIEQWQGQADALVTGEVDHHLAREAEGRGMAVIAAGHYATEQPVAPFLAKHLRAEVSLGHKGLEIVVLESESSPFRRFA